MSPLRGLPPGERLLWQGVPDWRVLAREAFQLRGLACYFGFIVAWCAISSTMDGTPVADILLSSAKLTGMALIPLGVLALYCWAVGRSTVYSITSRRIVIQLGLAVPMTINLPFAKVNSAGLRAGKAGFGDITLLLMPGERLAYLMLWPHARPWRMARTEPMLRAIPDAAHVGQVLARALAASASMTVPALAPQQQAAGIGAHAPIAA